MKSLIRFCDAFTANPLLARKVQAILGDSPERAASELAALSVELGTPFTATEYKAYTAKHSTRLPADSLDDVAGGVRSLSTQKLINAFRQGASIHSSTGSPHPSAPSDETLKSIAGGAGTPAPKRPVSATLQSW